MTNRAAQPCRVALGGQMRSARVGPIAQCNSAADSHLICSPELACKPDKCVSFPDQRFRAEGASNQR